MLGAQIPKVAATRQGRGFSALASRSTVLWSEREQSCAPVQQGPGGQRLAESSVFALPRTPTLALGPWETIFPPVFASASEAALESLSTASSKRDLRLGVAPRSAQNGNFVLSRTGPAAPWTLTLLLPADWKRLHRRPGWERGPSVPRGLQTGLGCKLSEKREGGGHGRPELGGPSAGRLPPGLACLSFQCGRWR